MSSAMRSAERAPELSRVLIQLFKGPLYHDEDEQLWAQLLRLRAAATDHVAVLGLSLEIDESEGYAFLRTRPAADGEDELPRLVARRALSFPVSLLLALLRKRLAEFDASSTDPRLVLSRDQIVEMLGLFVGGGGNDARVVDAIDAHIKKVVDLGFLRPLRSEPGQYEVRRLLKAFVDAQWLNEFDTRLAEYRAEDAGSAEDPR